MSNALLSSAPVSAVDGEFDAASDATTAADAAVRDGCRIPDRMGSTRPCFRSSRTFRPAAVEHVVGEVVLVVVLSAPDKRQQPF